MNCGETNDVIIHREILIISPEIIFVQKAFFGGLFSGERTWEGIVFGMNFAFQNGFGLSIKQLKH